MRRRGEIVGRDQVAREAVGESVRGIPHAGLDRLAVEPRQLRATALKRPIELLHSLAAEDARHPGTALRAAQLQGDRPAA